METATIVCAISLSSCLQSVNSTEIDSGYAVVTTDAKSDTALYYTLPSGSYIGRVGSRVVAVGWDANFIIVKRYPGNDVRHIEYYILDKKRDSPEADPEESVYGPFDEKDFRNERIRLGVPESLRFTKHFP